MGETTGISWCDHTFNPWIGCHKVSEACKHCYAEVATPTRVHRGRGLELWGADAERYRTSASNWREPRSWNGSAARNAKARAGLGAPTLHRPRVFCASLADVFEDRRDIDPWRADLFRLIEECSALDWLLLTKRPERVLDLVPESWRERFPSNVWIGTTAETQSRAEERIPHLLKIQAAVRFVSIEPQIETISLVPYLIRDVIVTHDSQHPTPSVDWVIQGGESGAHARPFDLAWARSLRDECAAAGVPYFFKQAGAKVDGGSFRDRAGADPNEWPRDIQIQSFPEARS